MNKSSGSKISFEPRAEEGRSIGESKIHVNPRAEEEQNHSKPRAEEERNTTSNLVRKRKEVIKSAETLKPRADRGVEYQFVEISRPRAEGGRNV